VEIKWIIVQGQPRQKPNEILISTKNLSMVVHICNPKYVGGINRRMASHTGLGKKHKTLSEK
jgi:hypothetical protein